MLFVAVCGLLLVFVIVDMWFWVGFGGCGCWLVFVIWYCRLWFVDVVVAFCCMLFVVCSYL